MDSTPEVQNYFPTKTDVQLGKRPTPEHYLQDALTWLRANRPAFFTEDGARDFYLASVTELCAACADNGKLQARLITEPNFGTSLADTSVPQLQLMALAHHAYARDCRERGRRAIFPGYWLDAAVKLPTCSWRRP